jgi:hypothetical protein
MSRCEIFLDRFLLPDPDEAESESAEVCRSVDLTAIIILIVPPD